VDGSWDSSVGIAIGCGLDGQGSIPSRDKRFLSAPQHQNQPWGPPSLLSTGYGGGALSTGVKQTGHEADHSTPSSAEFKNGGAIFPLPHMSSQHSAY
jgi:hypothetical protein